MSVSDIVTKPVTETAHGAFKGLKIGGGIGAMVGAAGGAVAALIPAVAVGLVAAVGGLSLVSGALAFGAVELGGAALGAVATGLGWGAAGAAGGGAFGLAVGALKGIKGFVEGVFTGIFGGRKKGDNAEVTALRAQSSASDGEMAIYLEQQRRARAAAIASVGDPDASADYAARMADQKRTASPSLAGR